MIVSDEDPVVSIIIPAFNEEECIAATLQAIRDNPPHNHYEVLVVDNGSTDGTALLVEAAGARLVSHPEGTIASVRNRGVAESSGKLLVFLDADVLVTEQWAGGIGVVIDGLLEQPMLVTGSRCLPPNDGNWFNRYWFSKLTQYEAPYINSGHLITSRALFDQIQGFTEVLKTAEDYDFCMKAKKAGGVLSNNPCLSVIHTGYPRTVSAFIRRERWHGREDFESWKSFFESKVGWIAAFNLALLVMGLVSLFITGDAVGVVGYFVTMLAISGLLSAYNYKSIAIKEMIPTSLIFYCYIWGRTLAIGDRFFKK